MNSKDRIIVLKMYKRKRGEILSYLSRSDTPKDMQETMEKWLPFVEDAIFALETRWDSLVRNYYLPFPVRQRGALDWLLLLLVVFIVYYLGAYSINNIVMEGALWRLYGQFYCLLFGGFCVWNEQVLHNKL